MTYNLVCTLVLLSVSDKIIMAMTNDPVSLEDAGLCESAILDLERVARSEEGLRRGIEKRENLIAALKDCRVSPKAIKPFLRAIKNLRRGIRDRRRRIFHLRKIKNKVYSASADGSYEYIVSMGSASDPRF